MINLLPTNNQKDIKARRSSFIFFKYIIVIGSAVAFLILASLTTNIFLSIAKNTENSTDTSNSELASVELELSAYKTNISQAEQILNNQVSYSRLLLNLASLLPSGSIIRQIDVNESSIQSSFNIEFMLKPEVNKDQLANSLKSSGFVRNFEIVSEQSDTTSDYSSIVNTRLTVDTGALR